MRPQPDLAHYQEPEPVAVGDTVADVISGMVMMLAIIAFALDCIGVFG
jgi:hypothetical protein